jgi:hypothetical protein
MRIELAPPLRPARLSDAEKLAELVNYAGEGLPLYLWNKLAKPGTTAWEVGRQRAMRETGSFSFRNAVIIEVDREVAGCLPKPPPYPGFAKTTFAESESFLTNDATPGSPSF